MKELIKTGYFNLTCNTKDCSCANERVLGTIFYRYFNNLKIINSNTYKKYWFERNNEKFEVFNVLVSYCKLKKSGVSNLRQKIVL